MLAQLSDPHIRLGDPAAADALRTAVAAVAALDPAPDAVLVSGDLADTGDPREYALVRDLLQPLPMPVHVLPGNHDDVAALEAAFDRPVEYEVDAGPLRLVTVDTTIPGEDGGRIPVDRLAPRLNDPKPTILAMHHAPLTTGVPAMDALGIPLADRAALADLLAHHPHVKRIVSGHLHRAMVGALGGVPVFTCPGANLQLALAFRATGELPTNDDPPGYALHLLLDGEVTSHLVPL
jgi:3',5'-cyclic AMP phosphodiesterase CpdA